MYQDSFFKDKTAVITGGTSGIGMAVVLELARQGCKVFFCGRHEDSSHLEEQTKGLAHFIRCDLAEPNGAETYLSAVEKETSCIDFLINNVAYDGRVEFEKATEADFDHFITANLRIAFSVTHRALKLVKAGTGRAIVNLGTTNWMLGLTPFTLYASAKAGVLGFTRALARELGPEKIRVNMISPGWVMTPKQLECYVTEQDKLDLLRDQALPFLMEERHIAEPVLFLLSPSAEAITGQNLVVDCGKLMQ